MSSTTLSQPANTRLFEHMTKPFVRATADMSKWAANIDGMVNNSQYPQIAYIHFDKVGMPYDETKLPKVFVDGEAYELPIINEQA